ncbi:MAG: universal stress protein [Solirubrobacteraceae bacterium]|nr:universal stress protein [Solirubrobacteraceae bacterium]
MLQTIIIGIDGRPQDAEALALAHRLADPGAEIIATSVAVIEALMVRAATRTGVGDVEADAELVVEEFTEPRVRTEGIVTRARSVGRGLARVARGASADLIVVASSRRGALGRTFAGDSVRDVLRHAPCPVAVAPVGYAAEGPISTIVVGYDGSKESDLALHGAVAIAQRDSGRVNVVEVVEPFVAITALGGEGGREIDAEYDRARTNLDKIATQYDLHGVIASGHAATELARSSRDADLLCIGLHEHGVLDRLMLGSTAHALLREQSAPLLISTPHVTDPLDHPAHDGLDSGGSSPPDATRIP